MEGSELPSTTMKKSELQSTICSINKPIHPLLQTLYHLVFVSVRKDNNNGLNKFYTAFHFTCYNWLLKWLTRAYKGGQWDYSRVSELLFKPSTDGVCLRFVSCKEFAF